MKSIHLTGNFGKLLLIFSLLFGIGIMTSTTAQAQWQNDRYNRNDDLNRQRAYEREQRRREREARREARRRNRNYDYNDDYYGRNRDYRDYGYNNGYGYGRSADGYGNYGGSFDLRQTALNAGFADGVKEGRRDRERGERYNYTDESDYQKATRDYSSSKGDRYTYQRYYREAFSHGYADGYSGY